jgi:hypothetical protein
MRRIFIVFALVIFACSIVDRTGIKTSTQEKPKISEDNQIILSPSPEINEWDIVDVSPFCTILDEDDTRRVDYGKAIRLSWGWEASTKKQVIDYIESAIIQVTFDGRVINDAMIGDIYVEDDAYYVFWEKLVGVLDRGTYEMIFSEEFRNKIFDGWRYFGPGTTHEKVEDKCYLIID